MSTVSSFQASVHRFTAKSVHCNETIRKVDEKFFPILQNCGNRKICGLKLKSTDVDLGATLTSSEPIFCQNSTTVEDAATSKETILNCPNDSTVVRTITFHRSENGKWVPILSMLCQTKMSSGDVYFVDAHERIDAVRKESIFPNLRKCPPNSAKGQGSRCTVYENYKFCSIKFGHEVGEGKDSKMKFLLCQRNLTHDFNVTKDMATTENYFITGVENKTFISVTTDQTTNSESNLTITINGEDVGEGFEVTEVDTDYDVKTDAPISTNDTSTNDVVEKDSSTTTGTPSNESNLIPASSAVNNVPAKNGSKKKELVAFESTTTITTTEATSSEVEGERSPMTKTSTHVQGQCHKTFWTHVG